MWETIVMASELGVVKKSGAWYKTLDEEVTGQGIAKFKQALLDNPKVYDNIQKELREMLT